MSFWEREQLTYKQVIDAVREAIAPLQRNIDDLRDKVNALQASAVQQTALDKYALKDIEETQHTAMYERLAKIEAFITSQQETNREETQERLNDKNQYISLQTTVLISVISVLGSGLVTLLVTHVLMR